MIAKQYSIIKRAVEQPSILLEEKCVQLALGLLTLSAFALRLIVFFCYMDSIGDGPTKAMYAYNWYKAPYFIWHGIWLPGFAYLTGLFSFVIHDPLVSVRLLNLIIGTLSVPLFYILVRMIYGHVSAVFACIVLAFLPVHVGLSASSLTETTFVFELIAGMLFLILATEARRYRTLFLIISLFSICFATMTRYEAWLFIPFFPCYYFWKTKKILPTIIILLVLTIFPLTWSINNYFHSGNLFLGLTAAKDETWATEVGLISAIKILGKQSVEQLEWTLIILAVWGLVLQFIRIVKKIQNAEQIFYMCITLFYWAVMLKFAMVRGETIQTRYLLLGFMMILPLTVVPVIKYFKGDKKFSIIIIILLSTFLIPKMVLYYPLKHVTPKRFYHIETIATWLKDSTYKNDPVLITKLAGQATYLPLYFPDIGPHDSGHFIYFEHCGMTDSRIKVYMENQRPSLLITRDEDSELIYRIEKILGKKFNLGKQVHSAGKIKVYDIK